MQPFHERLQAVMTALDMNATAFGKRSGINRVSMSKFLAGENKPGLETLEKICAVDERISADYLIRGVGLPLKSILPELPMEKNKALTMLFEVQAHLNELFVEKVKEIQAAQLRDINF